MITLHVTKNLPAFWDVQLAARCFTPTYLSTFIFTRTQLVLRFS